MGRLPLEAAEMGNRGVRDNSCRDLLSCMVRFCMVDQGDLEAAEYGCRFVGEGLTTEDYHT